MQVYLLNTTQPNAAALKEYDIQATLYMYIHAVYCMYSSIKLNSLETGQRGYSMQRRVTSYKCIPMGDGCFTIHFFSLCLQSTCTCTEQDDQSFSLGETRSTPCSKNYTSFDKVILSLDIAYFLQLGSQCLQGFCLLPG